MSFAEVSDPISPWNEPVWSAGEGLFTLPIYKVMIEINLSNII